MLAVYVRGGERVDEENVILKPKDLLLLAATDLVYTRSMEL